MKNCQLNKSELEVINDEIHIAPKNNIINLKNKNLKIDANFNSSYNSILVNNCVFENSVSVTESSLKDNARIEFNKICFESSVDFSQKTYKGPVKFYNCQFFGSVNFQNATFEKLADFYGCSFYKKTIFYKTDFENQAVFAGAEFKENVLFTYTSINKNIILRNTKFNKGLDLSLNANLENLKFFNSELGFFKTEDQPIREKHYNKNVQEKAVIHHKNARETFRILKHSLVNDSNLIEANKMYTKEMHFYKKEFGNQKWWNNQTVFILDINKFTNKHRESWVRPLLIILSISLASNLIIAFTNNDFIEHNQLMSFDSFVKNFFLFILPTHNINFLGDCISNWCYAAFL